jgi:hypothetical protein
MINFLEEEGTRICSQVFAYSKKWKQPSSSLLSNTQQQILLQKFLAGLRLVYRSAFVSTENLYL